MFRILFFGLTMCRLLSCIRSWCLPDHQLTELTRLYLSTDCLPDFHKALAGKVNTHRKVLRTSTRFCCPRLSDADQRPVKKKPLRPPSLQSLASLKGSCRRGCHLIIYKEDKTQHLECCVEIQRRRIGLHCCHSTSVCCRPIGESHIADGHTASRAIAHNLPVIYKRLLSRERLLKAVKHSGKVPSPAGQEC